MCCSILLLLCHLLLLFDTNAERVVGTFNANAERRRVEIFRELDALGSPVSQLQPRDVTQYFNDTLRTILDGVDEGGLRHLQHLQHHQFYKFQVRATSILDTWVYTSSVQVYGEGRGAMARMHQLSVAEADINRVLCTQQANTSLTGLTEGIVDTVLTDMRLPVRLDRLVLPFNPKHLFAVSSAQRLEQLCARQPDLTTGTVVFSNVMVSGVTIGSGERIGIGGGAHHFAYFLQRMLRQTVFRHALIPLMAEMLPWEVCCLLESAVPRAARQRLEAELSTL